MKPMVLPEVEAYAEAHSHTELDICRRLREETDRTMDCPQMVVGSLEGAFLKVMAMTVGAKRILENGTFTGFSALCFAESLPDDGEVVTCDIELIQSRLIWPGNIGLKVRMVQKFNFVSLRHWKPLPP